MILAMAMKCALNLHIETLAANCTVISFPSTMYINKLSRRLKACIIPQSKPMMVCLHEWWTLIRNSHCKEVHIFCTIVTLQNTTLTLQAKTIAMLDFNRPAEHALVIF
jgi:hypothetical protein